MNQHPDPEIHGAQAPLVPINMPENFGSMPGDSCALMSAVYEMPVEYQNDPDTLYAEVPPRTYVFLAAQGIYLNRKDEDSFTFKKALSIAEEWYVEISNVQ